MQLELKAKKESGVTRHTYFKETCSVCDKKRLCYKSKDTDSFVCRKCKDSLKET